MAPEDTNEPPVSPASETTQTTETPNPSSHDSPQETHGAEPQAAAPSSPEDASIPAATAEVSGSGGSTGGATESGGSAESRGPEEKGEARNAEANSATAEEGSLTEIDPAGTNSARTGSEEGPAKKKRKRRRKKKSDTGHHASDRAPFHVGEEVFGKVTAVLETAVMVDLSGKALAIFDRGEMEPDDLVPVIDDRFVGKVLGDGGRGGLVVLTRKPLREEEAKPRLEQAAKDGTLVGGLVTGVIKGGVEVLLDGVRAFAPASGVDLHPRTANFQNLVGQRLEFKITSYEKHGQDVVVTRRPMLEKEAHERRKKAREVLEEGQEMQGLVRTIVDWGAFVALPEAEYLEGLVHISELSHNPRDRVADVLKPGQKLKVLIQKIDEKGKIWLSRKALIEDPLSKIAEHLKPGSELEGEVTRVEEFGAFIKLEGDFEGLCHVADMSPIRVDDARKVMQPGEKVKVVIHHIDTKDRRVALHPALSEAQKEEPKQRPTKGQRVKVEILKIEQTGLSVRVLGVTGRQARGFVPAGQTGTPRGAELRKHFNVGDVIDTMVIDVDPKRKEAKLSVSRLAHDEERRAHKEYQAQVKKEAKFGTLGDLLKSKLGGG